MIYRKVVPRPPPVKECEILSPDARRFPGNLKETEIKAHIKGDFSDYVTLLHGQSHLVEEIYGKIKDGRMSDEIARLTGAISCSFHHALLYFRRKDFEMYKYLINKNPILVDGFLDLEFWVLDVLGDKNKEEISFWLDRPERMKCLRISDVCLLDEDLFEKALARNDLQFGIKNQDIERALREIKEQIRDESTSEENKQKLGNRAERIKIRMGEKKLKKLEKLKEKSKRSWEALILRNSIPS